MTTPGLREELQRIADRAPVADVPADTWVRARRSRRRTIATGVAAVVAVAAVGIGAAAGLSGRDHASAPVVGTGENAIPEKIAVPSGLEADQNLMAGQSAVALLTDDGRAVVIGATDGGRYHLLDLPGADGKALALSPNGGLLAYTSAGHVRILDLVTGKLRTDVDLSDSPSSGVDVSQLDWTPDSRGLVFGGPAPGQGEGARALVDTDDWFPGGELKDLRSLWASTELGGFVGVGVDSAWFHDGETDWRRTLEANGTPVAVHGVTPAVVDLRRDGDGYRMYQHDATTDTELALPDDFPTGDLTVAGWLPDSRMVVSADGKLLLVAYGADPSLTQIGTDSSGSSDLTIATDLMSD